VVPPPPDEETDPPVQVPIWYVWRSDQTGFLLMIWR
jgi:hypothetical protein